MQSRRESQSIRAHKVVSNASPSTTGPGMARPVSPPLGAHMGAQLACDCGAFARWSLLPILLAEFGGGTCFGQRNASKSDLACLSPADQVAF